MKRLLYLISILITVILVDCTIRRDVIKLDGISGEIWELMTETDTRYAEGYSHDKFGQIKIGMTEMQVIETIGEPLDRCQPYLHANHVDKGHLVILQYSESPSATHYRLRQVYLDSGKVAEIISYYYLDYMDRRAAANSTIAITVASCSVDSLVLAEGAVLRINICDEYPVQTTSAKRLPAT